MKKDIFKIVYLFTNSDFSLFMPIVNGSYVPDTLPGAREAQNQVFGEYSRRDMSDYSTAAYNYLMKQQEQAYNLELWKLTNEYNSPSAQMKRYQDAGLNPNLIYGQSNTAQAPASASATGFRPSNLQQKQMSNSLSMIGQIMNSVKAARETYDYMKYGSLTSSLENQLTEQRIGLLSRQETAQLLANDWNQFLQGRFELDPNAPAVKMYRFQSNVQEQRYEQLKALINMIPSQKARTQALEQLDKERLHILQSQTGFITNFNTGHPEFDSFFKMLAFFVMNSGT